MTTQGYPQEFADHQSLILSKMGYHVMFDIPSRKRNYERCLPCLVRDQLSVVFFVYQRQLGDDAPCRFRFCINRYSRSHYLELGDFSYTGPDHVAVRMDNRTRGKRWYDLVPKIGDYFWIEFRFEGTQDCKMFFKNTLLDTLQCHFYLLVALYVHDRNLNGTDLISYHITMADGTSPLPGNLNNDPLGFTYVTSIITVQGSQNASATDKTIQYSVHEDGGKVSAATTFSINPGEQAVSTIEFRILSYGIMTKAGEAATVENTPFDGSKEVMVQIVSNFSVNTVITHTGMYNWWTSA